MKNFSCVVPRGAFYIFCDISKTKMDSSTFANRLLDEKFVSLIPGNGFGWDNFVRISYATSLEQIEKGMNRIEDFLNNNT
jgi:aspartate aminotransferase